MLCANCGKNAKRAVVVERFELTAFAGVPSVVERMRVQRCRACGHETVAGPDLERALDLLTVTVASRDGRLSGDEARFLRKRLGLTQKELGERMGANKITISDWERGAETISTAHDYILRGLVLSPLASKSPSSRSSRARVEQRISEALARVHESIPKRRSAIIFVAAD